MSILGTRNDSEATCLKVLDVIVKPDCNFKRLEVVQQTGFWMRRFAVNLFPNHELYGSITTGDRLYAWIQDYSSSFKKLMKVERKEFNECNKCGMYYIEDADGHQCQPFEKLCNKLEG